MEKTAAVRAAAAAWLVCFAPVLAGMAEQWWNEPDMGHGLLAPLAIGWVLWRERARLKEAAGAGSLWGWALLLVGAGLNVGGAIGAGLFARSLGAWISAAGAVAAIGGMKLVWAARFPLGLGLFMLPKLALVYNAATGPLQLAASGMAAWVLGLGGVAVLRDGNVLRLGGRAVEVEAACSGLRYVLPLLFMAAVWGWQAGARRGARWGLMLAAAPVALGANAARVAVAAAWESMAGGWRHDVLGWMLFVGCLGVLWGLERGLRRA